MTWFDSRSFIHYSSSNKLPKKSNKIKMKERGKSNWWDNWVIERRSKSFLNADHFVARNILISLLLIFMFIMCSSSISSFLLQVVLVKSYLDFCWKRIEVVEMKQFRNRNNFDIILIIEFLLILFHYHNVSLQKILEID